MTPRLGWTSLALLLCGLSTQSAEAGDLSALDRFSLGIGSFHNRLSLEGRVDGSGEFRGSQRDFAEELDIGDRRQIGLAQLSVNFAEKHQLDVRHYSDSRTRTVALNRTLRFDDQVFPVQAALRGSAGFRVNEFTYTYWWSASAQRATGVQLGALRLQGDLALSGQVNVEGGGEASGQASVSEHLYAPLIGLAHRRVLGKQWRLYGEARAIRLSLNGVNGTALSATAGLEWWPWQRLGLALQYSDSRIRAKQAKQGFSGDIEVGFSGPQLILRTRF
ncbi:hypothetical protein [Pseudomarimonas arenosa]|uniref:Uncharacterized protein n=1 Tax=Pseudomarimonas arenosa TaxID=2774145 RepID=A0AAW3ZTZ8_9GAMM|nr:hypothetical protein [Pseudomarimonas arenosa]MBD8527586.1 hypothetical protein [Pseudomarimonas arenosa]